MGRCYVGARWENLILEWCIFVHIWLPCSTTSKFPSLSNQWGKYFPTLESQLAYQWKVRSEPETRNWHLPATNNLGNPDCTRVSVIRTGNPGRTGSYKLEKDRKDTEKVRNHANALALTCFKHWYYIEPYSWQGSFGNAGMTHWYHIGLMLAW